MTQGVQSIGAFHTGVAWADSEAQGFLRMPLVEETITANFDKYRSQILGSASQHRSNNGFRRPGGTITCELDLGYSLALLTCAFGTSRVTTGTFYEMADALPNLTFRASRGTIVHSSGPHKVRRMTISQRVNEIARIAYEVVGRTASAATASLSALTIPASDPCTWGTLRVRVADKADALQAGDEVDVAGFELVLDNAIEPIFGSASADAVEPERNDFRSATLRLDLPRGGVGSFRTWRDANTPLQFDIFWDTGTASLLIGGFTAYVQEGGDVPLSGPGILTDSIVLDITAGANTLGAFASAGGSMLYAYFD